MSTLRANTLKPITSGNSLVLQGDSGGSGVSGPSIDSNGDVDFSQNPDAKIKLPSGGGIYESDGSTEILTESSGAVTLNNVIYPANNYFIQGTFSSGSASSTPLIFTDSPTLNSSYFTVSSGVYTLVKAGVYFISFSGTAYLGAGAQEDELQVSIYKNSSTLLSQSIDQIVSTSVSPHGSASATFVGRFSASDTIDFRLDTSPDSNATIDSTTHFSLTLLFPE